MTKSRITIILILFLAGISELKSQPDIKKYLANNMYYIFDKNIHTMLLFPEGSPKDDPIIRLNYGETLVCSFDNFDYTGKNYTYTIYHCTPSWDLSEKITQLDYLEGYYYEDYIRDYSSSYNTLRDYIHYSFTFPNENIKIKYSGNYVLVVYEETPEKPSFIARFYVSEDNVGVSTSISFSKNPEYLTSKQHVNFTIHTDNRPIADPFRSLIVQIWQNNRLYNVQGENVAPMNISGSNLIYNYQDKFEFNGNNEFRFADLTSFKYLTRKTYSIQVENSDYNVYLYPEINLSTKPFISTSDINGKYYVLARDMQNSDIEAEYANVNFTLVDAIPFPNTDVYICGDFNGWQINQDNLMTYNYESGYYEASLYLKQGYYNYTYLVKNNKKEIIMESEIDGSFSETQNEYKIAVYYKNPGDYHYQLLNYHKAQ